MTYIVIEMQTNGGTTAIVPPVSYINRNAAEAAFHTILAAAATSTVEKHVAVMLTEDGRIVKTECYLHPVEVLEEQTETE